MRDVVAIATSMGPEQLLLALVFLASYSLALGGFATVRGRRLAMATGLGSAAVFVVLSRPWEAGVMLVGFASVGMGVFSALVWATWLVTASRTAEVLIAELPMPETLAGTEAAADQELAANLSRTRAASSSRAVNTAPILNSPGAE